MKTIKYLFLIILAAGLILTSCDSTVALGPRLNLDPPTAEIITPEFMENITGDTLTISGTAEDLYEVVWLYVTIEKIKGTNLTRSWASMRGIWAGDDFVSAEWNTEDKRFINWSLTIAMDPSLEGEYLISVGAENEVKNKGPIAQRRVIIDLTAPVTTILKPMTDETAVNDYKLRNTADLDKLHTREINIQYEIEDNFSVEFIQLELRRSDDTLVYDSGLIETQWNGKLDIPETSILDYNNPKDGKHMFVIVTTAYDKAGNHKTEKHGWIAWCHDAKIPWSENAGSTTDTGYDSVDKVYPGSDISANAYGKYGIKQITYTIDKSLVRHSNAASTYQPHRPPVTIENIPLQEDKDPSAFFNFTIKADDANDIYRLTIETVDIHGHTGTDIFYYYVYDIGGDWPLALAYGGSQSGTYKTGDEIQIHINLDSDVIVTPSSSGLYGGYPYLLLSNGAVAVFDTSSNRSNRFVFKYSVNESDINTNQLNVAGNVNMNGASINIAKSLTPEREYIFYRPAVQVVTSKPALTNVFINTDGTVLTLTFNKQIYKGLTGNIILTQDAGTRRAPAVLTKSEYDALNPTNINPHPLASYYSAGINGASSAGVVETDEKYILKYDIDTSGTTAPTPALITALDNAGAFKVTIPVVSSVVQLTSDTALEITLSGNFAPKVKGVAYTLTHDAGIVRDNLQNNIDENGGLNSTGRTFTVPGVNRPFIRVNRRSETLSGNPVVAALPRQAGVKFDCQTPGAEIRYSVSTVTTALRTNTNSTTITATSGGYNGTAHMPQALTMPTTSTTLSATPLTLGNANTNNYSGYLYGIRVQAGNAANANYEIAARSVIQFDRSNIRHPNGSANHPLFEGNNWRIFIRGGNELDGDNSVKGFPLNWDDEATYGEFVGGARMLTQQGTSNLWHWMTWEVNVPAYFMFLIGTVDEREKDIAAYGPIKWTWSVNLWANQYKQYPLYPGSSLSFVYNTYTNPPATATLNFGVDWQNERPRFLPD